MTFKKLFPFYDPSSLDVFADSSGVTPRQMEALLLRFNMDDEGTVKTTYDNMAALMDITRERTRQLVFQAIKNLCIGWGHTRKKQEEALTLKELREKRRKQRLHKILREMGYTKYIK